MPDHMNIGRYQFIWWGTWAWDRWGTVAGFGAGLIYDRAGRWGYLEIRRFRKEATDA